MARHKRDEERDRSDRHSRSRDKQSSHHHGGESKEERLLRKAREYVEREEGKKHSESRVRSSSRDRHGSRHEREKHKKRHGGDGRKEHRSSRSSGEKRRYKKYDSDGSDRSESRGKKRSHGEPAKKRRKEEKKDSRKRHKHEKEKKQKKSSGHGKKGIKKVKVNKKDLYPLGDVIGSPPKEPLDVDKDYFTYHQHLWVYLYREEGIIFGDLTSEEAHEAFERFARRFNNGKLEAAYYDPKGMPSEALEECKTTRHAWSFNTSETERQSLKYLQEGVRKQTEYDATGTVPSNTVDNREAQVVAAANRATSHPKVTDERRQKTPEERMAERVTNRRLQEHVRTAEDEFTGGRKDGRERQIEKRKEKAATIHGSAKDREETAMGGVELDDAALYGGGGTGEQSFEVALAREKRRTARRQEQKNARVAELQKKEQDKQDAMLKMLGLSGLKPGQKVTIAPRKDG